MNEWFGTAFVRFRDLSSTFWFFPVVWAIIGAGAGQLAFSLAGKFDRKRIAAEPMRRLGPKPIKPASSAEKRDLREAHRIFPQLGEATSEVFRCNMYVAKHRNAVVVWIDHLNEFLVFLEGSSVRSVKRYPDLTWDERSELHNTEEMTRMLRLGPGELPPYGGVAKMWLAKPDEWRAIGPRVWHRRFVDDTAFGQRFTNGFAFGVVPMSPDSEAGNIWVVTGENKIETMPASFIPEKGIDPTA